MKKHLFISACLITFTGLLCFFAASVFINYEYNLQTAEESIKETAQICAVLFDADTDTEKITSIGGDIRITVISSRGAVLADSRPIDTAGAQEHLNRPEIIAALNGTPQTVIRYSSTLGTYFLYYAVKVDLSGQQDGDGYIFIRTAVPITKIDAYLRSSLPVLILIFCAITISCFLFSRTMINRITNALGSVKHKLDALSKGTYKYSALYSSDSVRDDYEEINAIISEIDDVAQLLLDNMKQLQDEKNKAEYIINNISDAILAVNTHKEIVLINNTALNIFDTAKEITGKNILYMTGDAILLSAVNDCADHDKSSISQYEHKGRIYILTVKRIEDTPLIIIILSDITESREYAAAREEFFQNASHELKTPLTAIKGFNELCAINNKDKKLVKYIESITRETDRMLALISDMLKLSELTNPAEKEPEIVTVSATEIAGEILDTLSPAINEQGLTVNLIGQCNITAQREHIYELLKNLIENAVRYNTQGGSVTITLTSASIQVADTGIGIPAAAHTRIFERFYRVEKSRSIQSGGTGLGLSIVKHICNLYKWNLTLKSKPSVGTEITVTL